MIVSRICMEVSDMRNGYIGKDAKLNEDIIRLYNINYLEEFGCLDESDMDKLVCIKNEIEKR